jgi:thiamine-phosphate pyrophosphorylase
VKPIKPIGECQLYAFIDTAYMHGRSPEALTRQLCDGGADIIQLRAKDCTAEETRRIAATILPITRAAGVILVINDFHDVARELGAEATHLGQGDFLGRGYKQVSELRGWHTEMRVGLSSHSPEQARRAIEAGADYLGVGPVYQTGTKPEASPVTLEYVKWAAANVRIPWFAIGGINLTTLNDVLAAGARRVCAVSAILNAPDAAEACRQFKERLAAVREI